MSGIIYNVHVGEIALKGKNRRSFEKRLIDNIGKATGCSKTKNRGGRILLYSGRSKDIETALSKIFGIEWFSEAVEVDNDVKEITKAIIKNAGKLKKKRIKLDTKRAYKEYPLTSPEINKKVGMALEESGFEIDLKNPEEWIFIEILKDSAVISFKKTKGLGGLAVGSSGRVLSLLSGGIDSPVASWLMMKRGCTVDFIHLHAFPTNNKVRKSKIIRLVEKLKEYSPVKIRLYLVPYGKFYEKSFEMESKRELVIFRRFIMRLANRIAKKNGHLGFVTGDSVGQVASQTLDNLYVVNEIAEYPVYRPLIGYDKQEIVDLAKRIGTYEISIEKYRDCCSLVAERHPSTRAKLDIVRKDEEKVDIEKIVEETIDEIEVVEF